jgi:Holliday junction resolvase-like predicted endonuclease
MVDERPRASPIQAPRPERQIAFRTGISAESRAAAFLIAKGFRILARRWKSPVGEIDIVARRRSLLLFVEVKAREKLDDAAWSVTDRQRLRIVAAARLGWRDTPILVFAISVSMPCWWRRGVFRAISPRLSTPAANAIG